MVVRFKKVIFAWFGRLSKWLDSFKSRDEYEREIRQQKFMEKVIEFLEVLQEKYGLKDEVKIEFLKRKFEPYYERIIIYLHGNREEKDRLINGGNNTWNINNQNFDRVNELISNFRLRQTAFKQSDFNEYIALATVALVFLGLANVFYNLIGYSANQLFRSLFVALIALTSYTALLLVVVIFSKMRDRGFKL